MNPALFSNQADRLKMLHHYEVISADAQVEFDEIVHLAAQICYTPIAILNIIDKQKQKFQAKVGIELTEVARNVGLCPICIQEREKIVISDTLSDVRTQNNPVVTSYPYIRFYAGIPLILAGGEAIGTLCVVDQKPREITNEQIEALQILARKVVNKLELQDTIAKLNFICEYQNTSTRLSYKEQQIAKFFENAPTSVSYLNPDGKIIWANQAALNLLGYSHTEYVAKSLADFAVDREALREIGKILATHQKIQNYQIKLRCKNGDIKYILIDFNLETEDDKGNSCCLMKDISDYKQAVLERDRFFTLSLELISIAGFDDYFKHGSYKWILDRSQALWNEQGKPIKKMGSYTDITERKQAEVLLRERQMSLAQQEELLRNVLNAIPVGVWITDKQGNVVKANPAACQIWGIKPDDCDLGNLNFAANFEQFKAAWTDTGKAIESHEWAPYLAITKGKITLNECIDIFRFDRTRKTILNSAIPLKNDREEIIGSIVVNQDITEEKIFKQALKENQRLFQKIADATPEILYLYDLIADRNIYVNQQMNAILGYSIREFQEIEALMQTLVHPEDLPKVQETFRWLAKARDGQVIETEYRMQRSNGEWCWLISRDVVFSRTSEGLPHQILGTATDITKRKQAEVELQEMSTALANAVEGISRLDTNSCYCVVNKAYAHTCGYEPEEMLGMLWYKTIHPEDLGKVTKAYEEMLAKGKAEVETRGIRKDGSQFYKHIVMVAAYNKEEQFIGYHCFMKDITERMQSEQKIREQAALLDIATDAIFVKDIDDKILFWNHGAERLYGWTAAEAIGKNAHEFLYINPIDYQKIQPRLLATGTWHGEIRQFAKTGKEIIVESRWTLVYDEAKHPKSILVVNTDITDKKQLEAQFLRAQRMESLGTLASGIAHDLNNILAPILMAVQLLESQMTDERSMRLLPILKSNAKRGAQLVKQVLSFGRGIEGDRTIVQVRHLISEIRHIAKETFPKSIELYIDISPELWAVLGDATQLHQVFMNLCVNARDAMPNGGTLSVFAENAWVDENYIKLNIDAKVGRYIVVTIADTGIGISPEIIDRIFEPFFTTKELGKGTGLGLSTVIGIIKSHGGFINVYSEIGKGTEFKVYLPALEAKEIQQSEEPTISAGSGELILVVDDEPAIREITKTSLETHGYRVISASDGEQAIAIYQQNQAHISLVLLDMMMPNMEGSTTIKELQKINPNLKIIAMSGLTANAANAATSKQVKSFIVKPFTSGELLTTIQTVLNNQSKNESAA